MLKECITSFVDGRLRLRHPGLSDADTAKAIHELLASMPGIQHVQVNACTGSLLVYYDPEVLDKASLLNLLQQGEQWLELTQLADCTSDNSDSGCCSDSTCDNPCQPHADRMKPSRAARQKRKIYNQTLLISLAACLALGITGSLRGHKIAGWACAALSAGHLWQVRRAL